MRRIDVLEEKVMKVISVWENKFGELEKGIVGNIRKEMKEIKSKWIEKEEKSQEQLKKEELKRKEKKEKRLERYKQEDWCEEEEWKKMSVYERIMKRYTFTDVHQCLTLGVQKVWTEEERIDFHGRKFKWRNERMKEIEKIEDKGKRDRVWNAFNFYCFNMRIGGKLMKGIDRYYKMDVRFLRKEAGVDEGEEENKKEEEGKKEGLGGSMRVMANKDKGVDVKKLANSQRMYGGSFFGKGRGGLGYGFGRRGLYGSGYFGRGRGFRGGFRGRGIRGSGLKGGDQVPGNDNHFFC